MRDQNSNPNEYPADWDSGTYQTGASKPKGGQSTTITVLLVAVIFLGGLASALGVMNVRLLSRLVRQQQNPVLPVAVDATGGPASNFLRDNDNGTPQLPENGSLELKMGTRGSVFSRQALLETARGCVATVTVTTHQGREAVGRALVISGDGYLLTNAHLTDCAASMTVRLHSGETRQAALVASDAYSDLAVLYIDAEDLQAAAFAHMVIPIPPEKTAYVLQETEDLLAGSLLAGDLNRADGGMLALAVGAETLVLEITSFGDAAGPVFDGYGNVGGFLCRPFGTNRADGWMLPSAQIMDIATQLVEKGAVSGRPSLLLQVEELSGFCRRYWGLAHGLEVASVTEGSAAGENGLLEGDILLTLNGAALTTRQQLFAALLQRAPGDSVTLEVFRAGRRFTVTLPITLIP